MINVFNRYVNVQRNNLKLIATVNAERRSDNVVIVKQINCIIQIFKHVQDIRRNDDKGYC